MGRHSKTTVRRAALVSGLALIASSFVTLNPAANTQIPAEASGTPDKVSLYISAPFVQGSHVTGAGTTFDNFDGYTVGSTCPTTSSVGDITTSAGHCVVSASGVYGGASSETDGQFYGGSGSQFMAVPFYDRNNPNEPERSITFDFGGPVKYVGLWWSGGNDGNIVRFFDSANRLVAELSSNDVVSKLGTFTRPYNLTDTVPTFGGATQLKDEYFGNPRYATQGQTTSNIVGSNEDYMFIYTYLNLFLTGDLGVTKMQIAGPGFEFDNVTVSTVAQTIQPSMVLITEKTVPSISWATDTNLWVGNSSQAPSVAASSNVPGTFSYGVQNAGTTGCTVNSSTAEVSYSALGDCVVRASFTPTNTATAFPATKDFTFSVVRNAQTITWSPTTALDISATPSTPSALATSTGDGTISYAVTNAGATGCTVNSSTGVLTYTAEGNCVVRATASQTATYLSATRDITFVISAPAPQTSLAPTPYEGPIPVSLSKSVIPQDTSTSVTLKGERLNLIAGATINGKAVIVKPISATELSLTFPPLPAGTYDIVYTQTGGAVITQQGGLRVTPKPTTVDSSSAGSKFSASKRFFNYRGDRGPVVARDLNAIKAFVKANPGITNITCVGSTSGVPARATDPALAKARAVNACKIISDLLPGVKVKTAISTGKGSGQFYRAVTIFANGVNPN